MEDYNDNNLEQNNQNQDSDSQNPENRNPEPQNTVNPNPVNPNPVNQNPVNQNSVNQNSGYQNPNYQNQGYQNQSYQNSGYQNPGYQNPGFQNPNFHTQNFQAPPVNPGILYSLRLNGWSTFVGVFAIIIGALFCLLTFILASQTGAFFFGGAVFPILIFLAVGILIIIAGVMIINASDAMKKFQQFRDIQKVAEAFNKLNKAFVMGGVIAIFYIIIFIISIIAIIVARSNFLQYPFGY